MTGIKRVSAVRQATRTLLVVVLATVTPLAAYAAGSREKIEKKKQRQRVFAERGYIQTEAVERILLDVRVTGKDGRPARGLALEEFGLRLDGHQWPIDSVDEICAEDGARGGEMSDGRSSTAAGGAAATGRGATRAGPSRGDTPRRFVLYIDFSSLGQAGRINALGAAVRWLREVHRSGELVEVAGYAPRAGMKVIVPWTDDPVRAELEVRGAFRDRDLLDGYPAAWMSRFEACTDCIKHRCTLPPGASPEECSNQCGECIANARSDYTHTREALKALKTYLTFLGETPGSKAVILLTQNTVLSPGRFYGIRGADERIGSQESLVEQVGAQATESRASFYPVHGGNAQFEDGDFATVPGSNRASVAFASLLAEYTGGEFSRGPADTFRVLREAGRESRCMYRLGFKPPEKRRTDVYRAEVRVAGRALPWLYRVQYVSEADRLMRRARTLLAGITRDGSLSVVGALRPLEAEGRRWSVEVQVALDPSSLHGVPSGGSEHSRLDIGALLEDVDRGHTWELIGGTIVRRQPGRPGDAVLLYRKSLEGLRPGEYRLRVFVDNRLADQTGQDDVTLTLPHPIRGGFLGPVATLPGLPVFHSKLPLVGEEGEAAGVAVAARQGSAPLGRAPVIRGQPLQMTSWHCGEGERTNDRLIRYIEKDGRPVFRTLLAWSDEAGACTRVTDVFQTIELDPGLYTYRMAWRRDGDSEPRNASRPVAFTVREKATGASAVRRASQ